MFDGKLQYEYSILTFEFLGEQMALQFSAEVSAEDKAQLLAQSQHAEALETDLTVLDDLYHAGVEYIYIGARGDFSSEGLNAELLLQSEDVQPLFMQGATMILQIMPPSNP